jgi:hypothetical protein
MAGKIKKMINCIIAERAKGNPVMVSTTTTKLIVKGINPANYTDDSPDDYFVMEKLRNIAKEMNVKIVL